MKQVSIAIDGPSGAGKSTLARALAGELGLLYVDTGALYRTVGLYALRKGAEPTDADAVSALLPEITLELRYDGEGVQRVLLNGEDVSEAIRLPEASMAASGVSAHGAVRRFLLDTQRELAKRHSVVMDGRDIGTVVLPDADVKVFLTASAEARAARRYRELCEKGVETTFEEVLRDMERRDEKDSHRALAPLRAAEDAVLVDTSELSLEESVAHVKRLCEEKIGDGLEKNFL